jgi:hypothetical protein
MGMNTLKFLVLAASILALGPGSASAEADGPDLYAVTGVAADDVLNIRAEPHADAELIGKIPPDGTCVRNLGCKGGLTLREFTELSEEQKAKRLQENPRWCKIEYQGITGWVAGRHLVEATCSQ